MSLGLRRLRAPALLFVCLALFGADRAPGNFTEAERAQARKFSVDFIASLARGDEKAVRAALHPGIRLDSLPEKAIFDLTEEMFSGKVDITRYIFSLSGHLMKEFLRGEHQWVSYRFDEALLEDRVEGSALLGGPILYRTGLLTWRDRGVLHRDTRFELNLARDPARKFQVVGFMLNGGK
ncbi:MAG: hypothetical protein J0L75_14210 [Spirochaetes bacterium]|nr:hypothetical protein [Spirochaetota bacterium]